MLFRSKQALVLGGGGARGGAHLGVYKVLREIDYKPDIVVGTSIGGIVAALMGAGYSPVDMEALVTSIDFAELIYVDRSGSGLLGTEKFQKLFKTIFADCDLRDLTPQIAIMATDITNHRRVMLDKGPVVEALLATMAVPGMFPAVGWGDSLLVDGGVTDNVPTQAAYELGGQGIIAVDVGGNFDLGLALGDVGTFSKQLQRVFYWLLNLSKRQEVFDIWVRSSMISHHISTEYQLSLYPPDMLIKPDLPNTGILNMEKMKEAIQAGEESAREQIDQIQKLISRPRLFLQRKASIPPTITVIDYKYGV